MQLKNTADNFGLVARVLHWGLAAAIIYMLWRGYFGVHKALGLTILAFVLLRLIWRWVNVTPLEPGDLPRWQVLAARLSHWALYGLMLAIPLSGWLMSSMAGRDVSYFNLFHIPAFTAPDKMWAKRFDLVHIVLTKILIGMLFLHVAAAFYHLLVRRDRIMRRMGWGKLENR